VPVQEPGRAGGAIVRGGESPDSSATTGAPCVRASAAASVVLPTALGPSTQTTRGVLTDGASVVQLQSPDGAPDSGA
jgi:hypothetical protein